MIKIKYDCPESESAMTKSACGVYCKTCKLDIYDFRDKSLLEIAKIKADNPSITCGTFTQEQAFVDSRTQVQTIFRMAFTAIFVFGLNVTMLFGQSDRLEPNLAVTTTEVVSASAFISGTLKSEKGDQISGSVTYYYGEESFTVDTDDEGNFKIELPKELIGQKISFYFTAHGYEMKEMIVEVKASKCYTYAIELKRHKRPLLKRNQMIRGRF